MCYSQGGSRAPPFSFINSFELAARFGLTAVAESPNMESQRYLGNPETTATPVPLSHLNIRCLQPADPFTAMTEVCTGVPALRRPF